MATHICHGDITKGALQQLERYARAARNISWTIPPMAMPGDTAVFYVIRPLAAFVAMGKVRSRPKREPAGSAWAGWHTAMIGNIQMIPFRHRLDVAVAIPNWGWLRAPRRKTTVPAEFEADFLSYLGSPIKMPTLSAQENVRREQRRLNRSRNRWLRDQIIWASKGVCAACGVDYAKLVPNGWTSVLHGHHLDQLSASKEPILTDLSRLAAVCPTCHVLIHLDQGRPLAPEELKAQIRAGIVLGPTIS